jgi:hypothetical protein
MRLSEARYDNSETGCCARVDRATWDEKTIEWDQKLFLKDHIRSFLHVPLNFGSIISRDHAAVEHAAAYPEHPIWLTDEVSPWGADVYVAIDRAVPNAKMATMSGRFTSKVFEGPYRDVGQWIESMKRAVASKGETMERLYFFYATCPKCAKHYGKNEVVLFAQIDGPEPKVA